MSRRIVGRGRVGGMQGGFGSFLSAPFGLSQRWTESQRKRVRKIVDSYRSPRYKNPPYQQTKEATYTTGGVTCPPRKAWYRKAKRRSTSSTVGQGSTADGAGVSNAGPALKSRVTKAQISPRFLRGRRFCTDLRWSLHHCKHRLCLGREGLCVANPPGATP